MSKTAEVFSQVTGSTGKVKELVAEIAAASSEQAQGVDQINKAVNEMNHVTQQTAANAQESASASEELNSQSDQMRAAVQDLMDIVGGRANGKGRISLSARISDDGRDRLTNIRQGLGLDKKPVLPGGPPPNQVIPLDEDNFKDF